MCIKTVLCISAYRPTAALCPNQKKMFVLTLAHSFRSLIRTSKELSIVLQYQTIKKNKLYKKFKYGTHSRDLKIELRKPY